MSSPVSRLSDDNVLCSKEKNKGHSVCLDTSQLTVYCYECDEFVVNDTQDRLESALSPQSGR